MNDSRTDAAALRNAPGVSIRRGVRSSHTMSTMRCPDWRARSNIFGLLASTGAAPGNVIPRASQTMCMELAGVLSTSPGPCVLWGVR